MYLQNPWFLLGLWLLPLTAALLIYAHWRRVRAARRFVDQAMVARLMPRLVGPVPFIKGAILLAALGCLVLAGSRPRFGVYFEEVSQRGLDLFVLLDVSRSMTAEDVAPNRLERAKSDVRDLVDRLEGDRVGLIVFAGKPVVMVPLTTDHGFFRVVLDDVDTRSAARGGSLIGDGIRQCLQAMPEAKDRDQVIVLITDGEDHESAPLAAAEEAAARGVKIFTIGLGDTREGARIPVRGDDGRLTYVTHDGQEVWSKVDERLLREIAFETEGAYVPAGTRAYDLGKLYENHLVKLARSQYQTEKRKRYGEKFQWFLVAGLLLLLLDMAIPAYPSTVFRPNAFNAKAMTRTAACLLAVIAIPTASWAGPREAADKVKQGIDDYQAGDFQAASKAFAEADVALPDDERVAFDRACALAGAGELDKAVELFQEAAQSRDRPLTARSHYNLGRLAADRARKLFGEAPQDATPEVRREGLVLLAQSVAHFRDCLQLETGHADARHNLEVIRLWIKHMQEIWRQRDRQKQREEMSLLEFLKMLLDGQQGLRQATRALADEGASPRRRQAMSATESSQRELAEEITPLKEKFIETLSAPAPAGPGAAGAAPPSAETERVVKILTELADRAGDAMLAAGDRLDEDSPNEAVEEQEEAVEVLDQIYMAVVPFADLVQQAIATQGALVDQVAPVVQTQDESAEPDHFDAADAAWQQRFVAGWAGVLPPKAEQGLKQLEGVDSESPELPPGTVAPGTQPDPEAARQQMDALKKAFEKAIEVGPEVATLADEAAGHLDEDDAASALPKQEEALRRLKEIAELFPKQPQQSPPSQQPEQQPQDDQQQQPQDDGRQDQERPEQGQDQRSPQEDKLSDREAEAVLQRVRQRQREYRQETNRIRNQLYRRGRIEKDW